MSKRTQPRKAAADPDAASAQAHEDSARADLPTRSEILAELENAGVPLAPTDLAKRLGLKRKLHTALDDRLADLERIGDVMVNRKGEICIVAKLGMVTGTVQGHPDGFGFLVPDDRSGDLFLNPREMHKVLHGDRATAKKIGTDRRGRPEGAIVDVLQRVNREVVGRLHEERGVWFVEAENRRLSQDFLIPADARGGAERGQVVVVEILEQPSEHGEAIGRVKEVLGSATDSGIEIEIALRKHALPFQFSDAALDQASKLPPDVRAGDRRGRLDLTALPLVTIDGETAKDFDDAVYCERAGDGFRLIVAIADVSHYVRDGDALDADARERGTSVYFPRRVIPMLPEALSNELCSLKPEVDRLCVACDMRIDANGAVRSYSFHPAVMHSRARLTYTQVWSWLSAPKSARTTDAKKVLPHLQDLYALYQVLAAARARRGAIDFETVELSMEFDANGKITRIVPAPRNDAHKLIEECMLAANVSAAHFLAGHKQPALYRIHEGPPPEKLAALREFLGGSGLALGGGDDPTAADYARLIESIKDRPDFALLQTVLLRSLSQAQYSPENVGHFGLAYDAYAHFTSPIRRYPDLLVHRCIKGVLSGRQYKPANGSWEELGVMTSMTERRADEASRDVEQWLKCFYMQDKVGESFAGTISGVASFGIFVTLDGLNIDGLVHVTELGRDYYHFDATRHALVGERGGRIFQLASRVKVTVARVDLEQAKIDFTLPEQEFTAARASSRPTFTEPLSRESLPRKPQGERRSPRGKRRR